LKAFSYFERDRKVQKKQKKFPYGQPPKTVQFKQYRSQLFLVKSAIRAAVLSTILCNALTLRFANKLLA